MFKKRPSFPFQQSFGLMLSKRFQTAALSGCQNHRFIFLGLQHHFSLGDSISHFLQRYFIFLSCIFSSSPSSSLHSFLLIHLPYAENNTGARKMFS
jgi:hypothetical protein